MDYTTPNWKLFEDLVRRILESNNFQMQTYSPRGDLGFDFLADAGNDRWAIEVKYYRTARVKPSLIETAATRVANNGIGQQADKGMLVVSSFLSGEIRIALETNFNIVFVDRLDLRNLAANTPSLVDELDALIELDTDFFDKDTKVIELTEMGRRLSSNVPSKPDTLGTDLSSQLRLLKRGKKYWAQYEALCIDIIKYLFPNDLQGWHKQKSTDGGANRYDFVCRVRPTTEFWKFLIDHLNSRYIIFEFKNYSGQIKQGQVLTTEKYLLEGGLRKVAIILTRAGADKNARGMMQGAMRENGKLMLALTDDMVCEMLKRKEQGEDPTDFLFDMTDDFLLSLPR